MIFDGFLLFVDGFRRFLRISMIYVDGFRRFLIGFYYLLTDCDDFLWSLSDFWQEGVITPRGGGGGEEQ